jgi:hypothetical protein
VTFYDCGLCLADRESGNFFATSLFRVYCYVSVVVALDLKSAKLDEKFLDEVLE